MKTLPPDASLFLYTDGLNETMNARQEAYGNERMLRLLAGLPRRDPEALIALTARAVAAHTGGATPSDDLVMLCLHFRGNATPRETAC
jgi:sigma-B regulation protein RsbU (phosphoserine phosphatase)